MQRANLVIIALTAVAAIAAGPVQAQVLAGDPCPDASGVLDRTTCARAVLKQTDKDLNAVWKRVLADLPSGGDPAIHRDDLRQAQRAWIAFRDLDCEAASKVGIPKYWGLNRANCLIAHTQARIKALKGVYGVD